MPHTISPALETDTEEVLALYKSVLGQPFCAWDEHYPERDTIAFDLSRNALYVMKNEEAEIIAAISIDEDELVEKLDCWSGELRPAAELARLVVRMDHQNQAIARQMILYAMERLRDKQYRGVHFLVNRFNEKALRSYRHLGMSEVGSCDLYEQEFICFETAL